MKNKYLIILLLLMVSNSSKAYELTPNIQVHGFLSQAFTKTDHNNFYGNSESGSYSPLEVGLNAYWQATDSLSFATQAVYNRITNKENPNITIDYAFGRYLFYPTEGVQFEISLGRVKNRFALYNDVRDIPFIRHGVALPSSVYPSAARDLTLATDGIEISTTFDTGIVNWSINYFMGEVLGRTPFLGEYFFKKNLGGDFNKYDKKGGSVFAEIDLEYPIVVGVSYSDIATELEAETSELNLDLEILIFSLKSLLGDFTFVAEHETVSFDLKNLYIPVFNPYLIGITGSHVSLEDLSKDIKSFYLQGDYSLSSNFSIFLRHESHVVTDDDTFIHEYINLGYISDESQLSTLAWFTGFNWFISDDFLLNIEVGIMEGSSFLNDIDNPDSSKIKKHWNVFAASVAYQF